MTPVPRPVKGGHVNLRERLRDAPLVVTGVIMAVMFAMGFLIVSTVSGVQPFSIASVIGAACAGVVFGVLMSITIYVQRRRSGDAATARAVAMAVKTGRLPDAAEQHVWGPLLERQRRQARRLRWLGPVEFGLFAMLAVYLMLRGSIPLPLAAAEFAFFLALAIAFPIANTRRLRRIEALERQLDAMDAHATDRAEAPPGREAHS
jgi:uncharacterized membrane protein